MSILWSSSMLKELVNANSNKKWQASGVEIDSRKVKKGDLFCALNGVNHNGHDFIDSALERGATACLISEKLENSKNISLAKVDSVLETLEKMAKNARMRSKARFIAVTGSVGKTGTKDMIQLALSKIANTYSNESSYNNYLGVPLSLARIPPELSYCILEIGMNKKGEIRDLVKLVKPEVAILTAIEKSHLEGLKSLENIAEAKSEILESLDKNGCLIINNDTNFSQYVKNRAKKLGIQNIITYGKGSENNIKLLNFSLRKKKYHVQALCYGKKISWFMPSLGEHWIHNSLSILGLAVYFKIDFEKMLDGLTSFNVPQGRGNIINLRYKNKEFILIDDSYNSNPASLIASLTNFSKLKVMGKKFLVLGDMLELGVESKKIHKGLVKKIEEFEFNFLYTVGKNMLEMSKKLVNIKYKNHNNNSEPIAENILKAIANGDAILLKGSNSMNLKEIINEIINNCEQI